MRMYEVLGITEDEWNEQFNDHQEDYADRLIQQGKLQKKRAQINKASKELTDKRAELQTIQNRSVKSKNGQRQTSIRDN